MRSKREAIDQHSLSPFVFCCGLLLLPGVARIPHSSFTAAHRDPHPLTQKWFLLRAPQMFVLTVLHFHTNCPQLLHSSPVFLHHVPVQLPPLLWYHMVHGDVALSQGLEICAGGWTLSNRISGLFWLASLRFLPLQLPSQLLWWCFVMFHFSFESGSCFAGEAASGAGGLHPGCCHSYPSSHFTRWKHLWLTASSLPVFFEVFAHSPECTCFPSLFSSFLLLRCS